MGDISSDHQYGPEPEKGPEKHKSTTVPAMTCGTLEYHGQEREHFQRHINIKPGSLGT